MTWLYSGDQRSRLQQAIKVAKSSTSTLFEVHLLVFILRFWIGRLCIHCRADRARCWWAWADKTIRPIASSSSVQSPVSPDGRSSERTRSGDVFRRQTRPSHLRRATRRWWSPRTVRRPPIEADCSRCRRRTTSSTRSDSGNGRPERRLPAARSCATSAGHARALAVPETGACTATQRRCSAWPTGFVTWHKILHTRHFYVTKCPVLAPGL